MEQFRSNQLLNYFSYDDLIKIYEMDDLYLKAKIIVFELFKDKVDKGGNPYICHLLRVSCRLDEMIEKVAGLLHDTLEDTDVRYEDLIDIGFPSEILDIVEIVTKDEYDKMSFSKEERLINYYNKIDSIINSGNIHAIRVKEADMSDNYDLDRLRTLSADKQQWFHKKYGTQLKKLRRRIGTDR